MDLKEVLKSLTILYIEDDIQTRVATTKALEYMFRRVYSVDSAIDGFEVYKSNLPDIIVTDIDMPKVNGIEFIKKIRFEESDFDTPIIITTAYAKNEYLLEAVKLKLEDYILKPISYPKLLNVLKGSMKDRVKDKNILIEFSNGIFYNEQNGIIKIENKEEYLTKRENEILKLLVENRGVTLRYEVIEDSIWQDKQMSKSALKTLISKLKKKLGEESISVKFGEGYIFNI